MKPGDLISGKYRLFRRIAAGGMGEIWAGRNERTQRPFAIKILLQQMTDREQVVRRFLREAETTGSIRHPSIVDVFDAGQTEDGRPYIVMELLRGQSLEQRLKQRGPLRPIDTCVILTPIARGLQLAHDLGIVHRDLSASNVFLSTVDGGGLPTPKILDFGVSKLTQGGDADPVRTQDGAVLGSPAYMSPEQAGGAETVDSRSDIWALGVLLFQCLTGELPFPGRTANSMMLAIVTQSPRSLADACPLAPPSLVSLYDDCMVKDRSYRLASARDFAQRLEDAGKELAALGTAPSPFVPQRRAADRFGGVSGRRRPATPIPAASRAKLALAVGGGVAGIVAGLVLGFSAGKDDGRVTVVPLADAPARTVAAASLSSGSCALPEELPRQTTPASTEVTDLSRAVARAAKGSSKP